MNSTEHTKIKNYLDSEVMRITGGCLTDYHENDQQELFDIWLIVKDVGEAVRRWTSTSDMAQVKAWFLE